MPVEHPGRGLLVSEGHERQSGAGQSNALTGEHALQQKLTASDCSQEIRQHHQQACPPGQLAKRAPEGQGERAAAAQSPGGAVCNPEVWPSHVAATAWLNLLSSLLVRRLRHLEARGHAMLRSGEAKSAECCKPAGHRATPQPRTSPSCQPLPNNVLTLGRASGKRAHGSSGSFSTSRWRRYRQASRICTPEGKKGGPHVVMRAL